MIEYVFFRTTQEQLSAAVSKTAKLEVQLQGLKKDVIEAKANLSTEEEAGRLMKAEAAKLKSALSQIEGELDAARKQLESEKVMSLSVLLPHAFASIPTLLMHAVFFLD